MLYSSCKEELKKTWEITCRLQGQKRSGRECYTCQRDLSLQPVQEHAGENIHPWMSCPTAGGHAWEEAAALGSPGMSNFSGRSCGQWGTHTGAVSSTHCGREPGWSRLWWTVSCEKGLWWSRGKGEGTAQKNGCGVRQLVMTLIPLHCLGTGRGDRRAGNEGVKFSFGRKQSLGKLFLFCLCFSPSHSIFCWN